MSGVAYAVQAARWGCRLQNHSFDDMLIEALYCGSRLQPGPEKGPVKDGPVIEMLKGKPYIMGQTAEIIAQKYNISREEMDIVALRSHNNAERATKEGDFKEEIVPIELPQKRASPPSFSTGRALHPRPYHGEDLGPAAAFIPKVGKVTRQLLRINDGARPWSSCPPTRRWSWAASPSRRSRRSATAAATPPSWAWVRCPPCGSHEALGLKLSDFHSSSSMRPSRASTWAARRTGLNREITNVNGSGCGWVTPSARRDAGSW
jgi:acetyl-CoA C-acetyltransferase